METQSFNLTKEKWIPVLDPDFRIQELSLVELFREWESLKEMRGDNPPTTLALYRFLLAIMHRAYLGPKDTDHWKEIFQDNGKVVPTPVGVNRPSFAVLSVGESRCPHTRGGEPTRRPRYRILSQVVPTPVGVNQDESVAVGGAQNVVPTPVGVNRC